MSFFPQSFSMVRVGPTCRVWEVPKPSHSPRELGLGNNLIGTYESSNTWWRHRLLVSGGELHVSLAAASQKRPGSEKKKNCSQRPANLGAIPPRLMPDFVFLMAVARGLLGGKATVCEPSSLVLQYSFWVYSYLCLTRLGTAYML